MFIQKYGLHQTNAFYVSETLPHSLRGNPSMASSSGVIALIMLLSLAAMSSQRNSFFLHIAMPSHLRHLFKRNGRVHHIVKRNGNVRAVSAHSTGNIEATLVHQLEQQRKRANNLMHVRVPAVDGQTVVFRPASTTLRS